MSRRKDPIIEGNCYHVYNRGNHKENIFFERENYFFFLQKWRKYFDETIDVFCYCLMPNHYHFLLRPKDNDFSHRMQNFSISYVKAMNKKYNRVGHLYQGNFKAKIVHDNKVLLYLTRYIHLNPVDANLVSTPNKWDFSSYNEYLNLRHGTLVNPNLILEQFQDRLDYKNFVETNQDPNIICNYIFD